MPTSHDPLRVGWRGFRVVPYRMDTDNVSGPDSPLPFLCPKCGCGYVTPFVISITVASIRCVRCRHTWATALAALPDDVRTRFRSEWNLK